MTDQEPKPTPIIRGIGVDLESRCAHYHSALDIVAIKMKCCGVYYACKDCHLALAGHAIAVWPREEWDARAIRCGACGAELTIREYMRGEPQCPRCGAGFNPGCRGHWRFYFEE
ncbi:MAG TPA: CHY zinc finger protein [Candidatus Acidoferrum sp.]|nr:CHY zinc finger protein [Candidatus Acidoferrum sp.]